MTRAPTTGLSIGESAPSLDLPDTEGRRYSLPLEEGEEVTVVVFTCNHCPYVLAWQDRMVDVAREYEQRNVRFLAINPNDAERYPADSYEAMQARARDEDWPFPYLHDESQQVARSFGARTTPDVFVLDSELHLRYRGALDGDHSNPTENAQWLREALDAVLAGREPDRPETEPVGCSIKWKP